MFYMPFYHPKHHYTLLYSMLIYIILSLQLMQSTHANRTIYNLSYVYNTIRHIIGLASELYAE